MEFTIEASCTLESNLLAEYPCLRNFKFYEKEETVSCDGYVRDEEGERMRQTITKTKKTPKICIDTLDDLMNLIRMAEAPIIIDSDYTIEIYDGYRE